MKKVVVLVALLLSVCVFVLTATPQNLYDYDSEESVITRFLCDSHSVAGPSSAYPLTARELEIALDRIDRDRLDGSLLKIYDEVYESVTADNLGFKADYAIDISPQIFITDKYYDLATEGGRNSFYIPYQHEIPSISGYLGLGYGNNAFIEAEMIAKNSPLKDGIFLTSFDWLVNYRKGEWNLMGQNSTGLNGSIPFLARGSVGNDWVNLTFGRTPHKIGTGFTGNLVVDDNFDYQELMKVSFIGDWLTYDIMITQFDTQSGLDYFDTSHFSGMFQSRVVHRLEFNIWNKLKLSVDMGTLLYTSSSFDFRWLSPFMIIHNYYNYSESQILYPYDEANNINGFGLEWSIGKGWKVGGQFVLDQFQTFFEEQDSLPSAYGLLANVSWSGNVDSSLITAWTEFVYTNPYLYLNPKFNQDFTPNYNYDYILGYHRRGWQASSIAFSGYPMGPDSIVAATGIIYKNLDLNVNADFQIKYSVHGVKGITNNDFSGDFKDNTPTGENPEHRFSFIADCSYQIIPCTLDVYGGFGLTGIWNKAHTADFSFEPDGYVGLTWHML